MQTWECELKECASFVNYAFITTSIVVLILCAYVDIHIWDCEIEQCALLLNHACVLMYIAVVENVVCMWEYSPGIVGSKSVHHLETMCVT